MAKGDIQYLVFDYLAEVTMSILVRAREKSVDAGYARDFVHLVMKPLIHEIKSKGIRVVANAGGVNIAACAEALAGVAREAGVELISANAYLGAFPIAAALDTGADVVITGRCVDSAVTLGPLIHEFGWGVDDYDQLAAGSLAGHIIE